MTDLRTAAQQALGVLIDAQLHNYALRHDCTDALIVSLRAALAQQAEPVDTDCHTQGICQRSGYGIGKQADPQIEDRLARHGIPKP